MFSSVISYYGRNSPPQFRAPTFNMECDMADKLAKFISVSTSFVALCVGITSGFSFCYIYLYLSQWDDLIKLAGTDAQNDDAKLNALERGLSYDETEAARKVAEDTAAKLLARKVRVLCMVMTSQKNHKSKAIHIKATWGKRCNVLVFISSAADPKLPSIAFKIGNGSKHLLVKTREAFRYVHKHHINDADWFLKVDDATYVVLENLRYMLLTQNASHPAYFGCRLKSSVKQGYMSAGAGYVLSKEALRRFVTRAIPNKKICRKDGAEDKEIGRCLANVGVIAGDSRDELGRGRFFPFPPRNHLLPGGFPKNVWYLKNLYYPSKEGSMDCCGDSAVSFHGISPNWMRVFEYLVYHLHPYGISSHL